MNNIQIYELRCRPTTSRYLTSGSSIFVIYLSAYFNITSGQTCKRSGREVMAATKTSSFVLVMLSLVPVVGFIFFVSRFYYRSFILSASSVSTNGTSISSNANRFAVLIKFSETFL